MDLPRCLRGTSRTHATLLTFSLRREFGQVWLSIGAWGAGAVCVTWRMISFSPDSDMVLFYQKIQYPRHCTDKIDKVLKTSSLTFDLSLLSQSQRGKNFHDVVLRSLLARTRCTSTIMTPPLRCRRLSRPLGLWAGRPQRFGTLARCANLNPMKIVDGWLPYLNSPSDHRCL